MPGSAGRRGRPHARAGVAASARSRSATRSSVDSIPTESRTRFVGAANGPISVDTAHVAVTAKTAIGDIRIGHAGTGPVEITPAAGKIEVGVPAGTAVELDAKTPTGRVHNHVNAPGLPGRTVKIRARTSSGGDITVRQAAN